MIRKKSKIHKSGKATTTKKNSPLATGRPALLQSGARRTGHERAGRIPGVYVGEEVNTSLGKKKKAKKILMI